MIQRFKDGRRYRFVRLVLPKPGAAVFPYLTVRVALRATKEVSDDWRVRRYRLRLETARWNRIFTTHLIRGTAFPWTTCKVANNRVALSDVWRLRRDWDRVSYTARPKKATRTNASHWHDIRHPRHGRPGYRSEAA